MLILLIALATGALSAFAFQPAGLWPLMPLAFAVLHELLSRAKSLGRALLVGYLFGLGQFVIGLNWIATAFTYQVTMPPWLGWVAVVLLSIYLAVYPALATGVAWRIGRGRPLALMLALAGAWAVTEWLRAGMFTGFAWNPVGVSLVDTPWLKTIILIGTYGLSLLTVFAGGALWLLWKRQWVIGTIAAALIAWLLLLPGVSVPTVESANLRVFDAAQNPQAPSASATPPRPTSLPSPPPPAAPQLPPSSSAPAPDSSPPPQSIDPGYAKARPPAFRPIRIVQPNIGQEVKWRPGFADEAARRLATLSNRPGGKRPRLLFWPEAAVTEPLQDRRIGPPKAFARFERTRAAAVLGPGEYLLTGGISLSSTDGQTISGATNSIFVLAPDGKVIERYDKAHLVPYGEYLPMRPLLSTLGLSRLAPGETDFDSGPGPLTLDLPGWGKVGMQICYEIIFSGHVVDGHDRPDFIFNPSNDAWFGRWGPPQHLAQARLRAAEEGLPIIRATPTGISAVIDARGKIVEALPWHTAGVIDTVLPPPAIAPPPFARFGNIIPLLLAFGLLISAIALARPRRYRHT